MTTPNNTYVLLGSDGNTVYFDDIEYGVLREDLEGLSNYPADYDTASTPGVVGERVLNTIVEPRELSFRAIIFGEGRAQLEERRRRLVRALNPLLGPCRLYWTLENGKTYYVEGRPDDGTPSFTSGTTPNARTWECEITLICHDPCWHAYELQSHVLISDDNGFHIPFCLPLTFGNANPEADIENNGTAPAPILVVMNGPLTAPIKLKNTTTGKEIVIRKNILAGDYLTVDTNRSVLSVTYYDHTTGTTSSALSYCSVGSQFWELIPGVNHVFLDIATIGTGARATLAFRERQVAL